MARDFVYSDPATDYLEVSSNLGLTSFPVTVLLRFNSSGNMQFFSTCWSVEQSGADQNGFRAKIEDTNVLEASVKTGGTETNLEGTDGFTQGVWNAAAYWFRSSEIAIQLNNNTPESTAHALGFPSNLDTTRIGDSASSATDIAMSGALAEVAVFDVDLPGALADAYARGVHPLRLGVHPVAYWPVWGADSPEPDLSGGGNHATVNDTLVADHPPVQALAFGHGWTPTPAAVAVGGPIHSIQNAAWQGA